MKNCFSTCGVFIIFGFLHHCFFVNGCIFKKQSNSTKPLGYWDLHKTTRKMYPSGCDCGTSKDNTTNYKPWIVFVHSQRGKEVNDKLICTGTILTSNVVATSHECLIPPNRKLQAYDAWRPHPKWIAGEPVVDPKSITLSSTRDPTKGNVYSVKDIILNTRFAVSNAVFRGVIRDNLVLLVVEGNLFDKGHSSVCLPKWKDKDVVHQMGLYYDVNLNYTSSVRSSRNSILNPEDKLVIMKGKECDGEVKHPVKSAEDALCVRYTGLPMRIEGGPLVVTSTAGHNADFLVGIASNVRIKNGATTYRYVYFANIISLVRYIEFYADKMGSLWCSSSTFKLGAKVKPNPVNKYPWYDGPTKDRDESLDCACGIRNNQTIPSKKNGRIAGGAEAEPYEFPWLAKLLLVFETDSGKLQWFDCGGSIINDRMILTAAHCVSKVDKDNYLEAIRVIVSVTVHKFENDEHGRNLEVEDIYYHPDYLPGSKRKLIDSDVALLVLKEPLKFSTSKETGGIQDLRPVCLGSQLEKSRVPSAGQLSTVAGWGLLNPDDEASTSAVLQKIDLPILPREKCQDLTNQINENMICAGYLDKMIDAAAGDSGGPLIVLDKTHYGQWGGQWFEIGIVSFGSDIYTEQRQEKTVGVYTNVQNFLHFVDYYSDLEGAKWCKPP